MKSDNSMKRTGNTENSERLESSVSKNKSKLNLYVQEQKGIVTTYTSDATVHGLKYINSGSVFRRVFWLIVCIAMITAAIVTLYDQTKTITDYPTITKQDIVFGSKLPFPAVTICNLNQVTAEAAEYHPGLRIVMASMSPMTQHLNLFNWSDPLFDYYENNTDDYETNEEQLFDASHDIEDTLTKCVLDNELKVCTEIFKTRMTDFGVCYTFNGRIEGERVVEPWVSTVAGNKYGLGVTINVEPDQYVLGENNEAAGIRVVLHDYNQTPIVQDQGFNIGPGFSTYASISLQKIKFLPSPHKAFEDVECFNTHEADFSFPLKYSRIYDYNQCILECEYAFLSTTCGCKGFRDKGPAPYCTPRKIVNCYIPKFYQFRSMEIVNCKCPFPCEHNIYGARLSSASYPSKAVADLYRELYNESITEAELQRETLELRIFYENFITQTTEHTAKFTTDKMFSTFGGQWSLFLGASIISIVELLEFLFRIVYSQFRTFTCCRKRNPAVEPDIKP